MRGLGRLVALGPADGVVFRVDEVANVKGSKLGVEDLPTKIGNYRPIQLLPEGADIDSLVPLAEMERSYILRVLQAHGANRTLAARTLGLDRKTLYRKLEGYRLRDEEP